MMEKINAIGMMLLGLLTQMLPPQMEVVTLAEGRGKKTILVRDGYKAQTFDTRKAAARKHEMTDLGDLMSYAKRAANPIQAVLFCAPSKFVLMIDDMDDVGREAVAYLPTLTQQAKDWLGKDGKGAALSFTHLKLKKFVEDHERDLSQSNGLLLAVSQFGAKTEMTYNAALGKSGNKNIGFTIHTGQVEGTVELPPRLVISIPLFEGWTPTYCFEVRLDWSQDDEAVKFTLEPINVQTVIEEVIAEMVAHAKAELGEDWLVVRGTPSVVANQGL